MSRVVIFFADADCKMRPYGCWRSRNVPAGRARAPAAASLRPLASRPCMQNQQQQHFYIELSALADLRVLLFATGCQAAQRLWGTIPEVPAKRFADAGRAVLPCMLRPAQVPLLVRLMADEGIVGE